MVVVDVEGGWAERRARMVDAGSGAAEDWEVVVVGVRPLPVWPAVAVSSARACGCAKAAGEAGTLALG